MHQFFFCLLNFELIKIQSIPKNHAFIIASSDILHGPIPFIFLYISFCLCSLLWYSLVLRFIELSPTLFNHALTLPYPYAMTDPMFGSGYGLLLGHSPNMCFTRGPGGLSSDMFVIRM